MNITIGTPLGVLSFPVEIIIPIVFVILLVAAIYVYFLE
jgi:hypothetical protein